MGGRKFQNEVKNCTPSEGLGGGFPTPSLLNNMTKKRHSVFHEIEKKRAGKTSKTTVFGTHNTPMPPSWHWVNAATCSTLAVCCHAFEPLQQCICTTKGLSFDRSVNGKRIDEITFSHNSLTQWMIRIRQMLAIFASSQGHHAFDESYERTVVKKTERPSRPAHAKIRGNNNSTRLFRLRAVL